MSSTGTAAGNPTGNPPGGAAGGNPGGNPPRGATTAPVYTPFKPPVPKMGGLVQTSATDWCAWTGGQPLADWSGLDPNAPALPKDAYQYRPSSPGSAQKSTKYREIGLDDKFTKDGHLLDFTQRVNRYLQRSGMDTITYLPDPSSPADTISVVTEYSKFDLKTTSTTARSFRDTLYDTYDINNDDSAKNWLLDSLDPDLKKDIEDRMVPDDGFIAHWMQLIHFIQSTSFDRFESVKKDIEQNLTVFKFEGQNVKELASALIQKAKELDNAGFYEHRLTLHMLNRFLEGGGHSNDVATMQFHHALFQKHHDLNQALIKIGRMSTADQNKYMSQQGLTFRDICSHAEEEWKALYDAGRWPPARTKIDTKRVPPNFGANTASMNTSGSDLKLTQAQWNVLMQQAQAQLTGSSSGNGNGSNRHQKKGNCNKCGKPGHWARECPLAHSRPNANPNRNGHGNGNSNVATWKTTNPCKTPGCTKVAEQAGHTKWKLERNGRTFYWCAKCGREGRWSTTHWTAEHTGKPTNNHSPSDTRRRVSFNVLSNSNDSDDDDFTPCAFHLNATTSPSIDPSDLNLLGLFGPYLPILFIWLATTLNSIAGPLLWFGLGWLALAGPSKICDWFFGRLIPWIQRFDPHQRYKARHRHHHRRLRQNNRWKTMRPKNHRSREWRRRPHRPKARRTRRTPSWTPWTMPRGTRPRNRHTASCWSPPRNTTFDPRPRHRSNGGGESGVSAGSNTVNTVPTNETLRNRQIDARNQRQNHNNNGHIVNDKVCHYHGLCRHTSDECWLVKSEKPFWEIQNPYLHEDPDTNDDVMPELVTGHNVRESTTTPGLESQSEHDDYLSNQLLDDMEEAFAQTSTTIENDTSSAEGDQGEIFTYLLSAIDYLKASLIDQAALSEHLPNGHQFPVIWDSGASVSLTFDEDDFVGPIQPPPENQEEVGGIGSGITITGIGTIAFTFKDTTGNLRTILSQGALCKTSKVKLMSTTAVIQHYPGENVNQDKIGMYLTGSRTTTSVRANINPKNNLPTALAYKSSETTRIPKALSVLTSVVNAANANLNSAQKEWLKWHYRMGHMCFIRIQYLMRSHVLAKSPRMRSLHTTIGKMTEIPKCAACQFSKARKKSTKAPRTHTRISDAKSSLRNNVLHPGQEVSNDHFICSTLGRLYTGFGKSDDSTLYKGGSLFVDGSSGFAHVEHQTSMTTHETLRSKEKFEFECRDHGVTVQTYRLDQESSFTSLEYSNHLRRFEQTSKFAGTGGHHHNGIVEKSIQDIMSIARTLMIHASIHWPDVADAQLWPMAVDHAVFIHNHVPRADNGLSPHDLFTRQRWPHTKFHDLHVWGCPVYVLDKRIADGQKLPRWEPRSTRHIYLGMSKQHASNVPLLLNPETGAITTQFHVVYDDWFATVPSTTSKLPDYNSKEWLSIFEDSEYQYPQDTEPPLVESSQPTTPLSYDTYDVTDSPYVHQQTSLATPTLTSPGPTTLLPNTPTPTPPNIPVPNSAPSPLITQPHQQRATPHQQRASPDSPAVPRSPSEPSVERAKTTVPSIEKTRPTTAPTKSRLDTEASRLAPFNSPGKAESTSAPLGKRERRPPTRFGHIAETTIPDNFAFMLNQMDTPIWNETTNSFEPTEASEASNPFFTGFKLTPDHPSYRTFDGFDQSFDPTPVGYYEIPGAYLGYRPDDTPKLYLHCLPDPQICKASIHDPDTLTWEEAMAESPENVERWLASADKEIRALEQKETWTETTLSEATVKVIPGTWVFRRKRSPSGEITKYKVRWVLRGDLQEVDFDCYSAVVAWPTVRIFLVLSLCLGWIIKALDFDNAFVQAVLDHDCFAYLPRGYYSMIKTHYNNKACLKLNKSISGLKVAPKLWAEHLLKGLKELGFKQSQYDQCLMYKDEMLLVVFVDDCGLAVKYPKLIKWFVDELRDRGFELQVEGDFIAFLGVAIEEQEDGSYHIHQSGLIQKIIAAAKMEDCKPNWTPASLAALGSDPDGEPYDNEPWKYSSIVGMLIYLSTNTRPDISFAVSQVAQFSKNPKKSHATAVKTIIRYLKRTESRGMLVRFSKQLELVNFVDADHAGLFGREEPRNPDSARSRSGYIILFGGMPLFWKSCLMTAICLSTLEAEYQSLSLSMRQLIAYKLLIEELLGVFNLPDLETGVATTVWEDNQGALYLATNQRLTNRTKYFHVKWHHFWSHVGTERGDIRILKVDTLKQAADYLTKSLPRELFENCRKLVQGW